MEKVAYQKGGLFTKTSEKDIVGSFSVLLSHILRNDHQLKYINSAQFLSQTIQQLTCEVV